MSYHELWTILTNWKKEFTSREFSRAFYSPDSNKVLHDMAKKGMLERVSTGRYRVRSVGEYAFTRNDAGKAYSLLKEANLPYTLTGVDAVYVWTHGGYNVDRFFGFYPIHIRVKKAHVSRWKNFLARNGRKAILAGVKPRETLFGPFFMLYPEENVTGEEVGSFKVSSLKETVAFCKNNIYAFEPALEMLDEEYNLGLGVRHSEMKTNV